MFLFSGIHNSCEIVEPDGVVEINKIINWSDEKCRRLLPVLSCSCVFLNKKRFFIIGLILIKRKCNRFSCNFKYKSNE